MSLWELIKTLLALGVCMGALALCVGVAMVLVFKLAEKILD